MKVANLVVDSRFPVLLETNYSFLDWLYNSQVLPFNMELQTQSNWCWAATSTSVSHFYSLFSPWTQCKVAKAELNKNCCDSPVPAVCNVPWYLDKALDQTNNFVSIQSGTISWNKIKMELAKGLVIGARIGWSGGGGHFMVIHGVTKSLNVEYLHIDDPIYGKNTMTYQQFATNYQGSGTWTHTYFTKKYYYLMWFKDLIYDLKLLKPIPPVRPMLTLYGKTVTQDKQIPDTALSLPHYTYTIGLDSIGKNMKMPETPTSLRIMENDKDEAIAMYELGLDEKNPELIQMSSNSDFFVAIDNSLGRIKEKDKRNKETGEIRLIKIPALNLEAVWLHYSKKTDDIINVIKRFDSDVFDSNTTYTVAEFLELVTKVASKIDMKDDQLGA